MLEAPQPHEMLAHLRFCRITKLSAGKATRSGLMGGGDLMTVPQLMQVKVSYQGDRSSDLDACSATLQIGQDFIGTCRVPSLRGYSEPGLAALSELR